MKPYYNTSYYYSVSSPLASEELPFFFQSSPSVTAGTFWCGWAFCTLQSQKPPQKTQFTNCLFDWLVLVCLLLLVLFVLVGFFSFVCDDLCIYSVVLIPSFLTKSFCNYCHPMFSHYWNWPDSNLLLMRVKPEWVTGLESLLLTWRVVSDTTQERSKPSVSCHILFLTTTQLISLITWG